MTDAEFRDLAIAFHAEVQRRYNAAEHDPDPWAWRLYGYALRNLESVNDALRSAVTRQNIRRGSGEQTD